MGDYRRLSQQVSPMPVQTERLVNMSIFNLGSKLHELTDTLTELSERLAPVSKNVPVSAVATLKQANPVGSEVGFQLLGMCELVDQHLGTVHNMIDSLDI